MIEMNEYIVIAMVFLIMLIGGFILFYGLDADNKNRWDEINKDGIKQAVEFNKGFMTLTDCTDMTLQLTEHNRFYNQTFRDEAWGHYKDICK